MAGGKSFGPFTLTTGVGATRIYDLTKAGYELSAEELYQKADWRYYPQCGATINHMATIECTGYDISTSLGLQASSASPTVGSEVQSVVLTMTQNCGAASTVTVTLGLAKVTKLKGSVGHNELATLDLGFAAIGTGGTEATVSIATA